MTKRYEQAVTHAKWYDGLPPEPKPPYDDDTFQLVTVIASGSSLAFYWQKEEAPKVKSKEEKP